MISGMNVFSFLAIPFFIFSGELMLHGGIAAKIVTFAKDLMGHWRGGLGMANVVACTIFGGVSGSPVADVSAMGGVMIPMMKEEGYSADYAVNVTTHASLAGAPMPTFAQPDHLPCRLQLQWCARRHRHHDQGRVDWRHDVCRADAGRRAVDLHAGCVYYEAVKYGFPIRADGKNDPFAGWNAILHSFIAALPGMSTVAIILGCIVSGICTATEAAGIAVLTRCS